MISKPQIAVAARPEKPLLLFDGDCYFCRRWVERWKVETGQAVDYLPYQEVVSRFPEIPIVHFERAVQFVEPSGKVYEAAHGVYRALSHGGRGWALKLYEALSPFRVLSEWFYRLVAGNRVLFSRLTRTFWGAHLEPPSYQISVFFFLKFLSAIYVCAFISWGSQIPALVGSHGISPVAEYLKLARENFGVKAYFGLPTLLWLSSEDWFLTLLWAAGAVASALAFLGILPAINFFLAWVFYLSLANAGQEFMAFQWDALLLETGFLAIFFAPLRIQGSPWKTAFKPASVPASVRLLYGWLLFRLMYFSGVMKLRSHDLAWSDLTALQYHFETQPLPTWIGWYFHQLPLWFHKFSVAATFFIELAVPFLILGPRRLKFFAFWSFLTLQVLILATGNYCFFNLLTIALSFLLIDDVAWPRKLREWLERQNASRSTWLWPRPVLAAVVVLSLMMTSGQIPRIFSDRNTFWPEVLEPVRALFRPLRSFNQYGLFSVMTTERFEIVLEGSHNRIGWDEYQFKYKPGDPKRRPGFNIPHQPRLDWQMWFAALGRYQENLWFVRFCREVLKGNPEVLALLSLDPFAGRPPEYLRAVVYQYHFTDAETRKRTGEWWTRERKHLYMPIMSSRS